MAWPPEFKRSQPSKGFSIFEQQNVQVTAGNTSEVNIALQIAQEVETAEVTEETTKVSVDPGKRHRSGDQGRGSASALGRPA